MVAVDRTAADREDAMQNSANSGERQWSGAASAIPPSPASHADRQLSLAADRTMLAAERTYAAWVRTGLAALASGIGARALLDDIVPRWMACATATVLILFSCACFGAAVWREMTPDLQATKPDTRRIPAWFLLSLNGFLALVALTAVAGVWTSK